MIALNLNVKDFIGKMRADYQAWEDARPVRVVTIYNNDPSGKAKARNRAAFRDRLRRDHLVALRAEMELEAAQRGISLD